MSDGAGWLTIHQPVYIRRTLHYIRARLYYTTQPRVVCCAVCVVRRAAITRLDDDDV